MGYSFGTPFILGSLLFIVITVSVSSGFFHKRVTSIGSRMYSTAKVKIMSVVELGKILQSSKRSDYQIIDVREKNELSIAKLPDKDVINLPLSQISRWLPKVIESVSLDKNRATLCLCHHGVRSNQVAQLLGMRCRFVA
jgi:rhodanese-related sulfurtransferase